MRLIAEPHQIECRITYIDLPILDPGRLTKTLEAMIRISPWGISAPKRRSTPSCAPDRLIQLHEPVSRRSSKGGKLFRVQLESCGASNLPSVIEEEEHILTNPGKEVLCPSCSSQEYLLCHGIVSKLASRITLQHFRVELRKIMAIHIVLCGPGAPVVRRVGWTFRDQAARRLFGKATALSKPLSLWRDSGGHKCSNKPSPVAHGWLPF